MEKVKKLRAQYPEFVYDKFSYKKGSKTLDIKFHYRSGDTSFVHALSLSFPKSIRKINTPNLESIIFSIGVVELFSYWKAFASPVIRITAGSLDDFQTKWFEKLLERGMGEYFYKNGIDFTVKNFVKIISANDQAHKGILKVSTAKTMVSVSGGIDSSVTAAILKENISDLEYFKLNPTKAAEKVTQELKIKSGVKVKRSVDPKILELNGKGFLNGHIPFSAVLAFVSTLAAYVENTKFVVFSNEQSANDDNVTYLGRSINHQYSKTYEFEKDFREYLKKVFSSNIEYFSFVRPIQSTEIIKLFARRTSLHSKVKSCNVNQKEDSWCCNCPKCVSIYTLLYPIIGKEKIKNIFPSEIFESKSNEKILTQLYSSKLVKPFECVGTREEILESLMKIIHKEKKLPRIIKPQQKDIKQAYRALGKESKGEWSDENFIPKSFKKQLKEALTDKVLILGFGREGQSTLSYLLKNNKNLAITVSDIKKIEGVNLPKRVKKIFGKNYTKSLDKYDIVYKSPGINLPHQDNFSSATELFFANCDGQIIGVTGTKGKSTTTSLIFEILKKAGKDAELIGNIGRPALDFLGDADKDKIFVFELSSYQLDHLDYSPHVAVFLNFYKEHQQYHYTMDNYFNAKANITLHQGPGDCFIFNTDFKEIVKLAKKTSAKTIPFSTLSASKIQKNMHWHTGLSGKHNTINIAAAVLVAQTLGINANAIKAGIRSFGPLAYRLQKVGSVKGVTFISDSLATIPEATIAAMESQAGPLTLILGGEDRGQDFAPLASVVSKRKNVQAILIGQTAKKIATALKSKNFKNFVNFGSKNSMQNIVQKAFELTPKKGTVLMSPGAPSFDMFKDYSDRGDQFAKAIKHLTH